MTALLSVARSLSLIQTVRHAKANSPYYKNLPDLETVDGVARFLNESPITTKEEFRVNGEGMRYSTELPAYMLFTGGTTGSPSIVYGTYDDIETIYCRHQAAVPESPGDKEICLTSGIGSSQGICPIIPGRVGSIAVPLRSRRGYEWAWEMLIKKHTFSGYLSRITRAMLPLPAAKKLVHFILDNELDPELLALRELCTFSFYLSPVWREKLSETLHAEIVDVYGLTEIMGARAFSCAACGFYHFNETVLPEVVHIETGQVLAAGFGRLLLTLLYPHCKASALFRYDTGDVVEIGQFCDRGGECGIRPKGKLTHSILSPTTGEVVLCASDIQDFMDGQLWVARIANTLHSGVTSTECESFPKWRIRKENREAMSTKFLIEVELCSNPRFFRDQWEDFKTAFWQHVRGSSPTLKLTLERPEIEIELIGLPPGGLDDSAVFKV